MLDAHIRPWAGSGVRHIPAGSPYGVLDTRFAGRTTDNRWNDAGDPTFYIAGDVGVAMAEFARHYQEKRTPHLALVNQQRALYRLDLELAAVVDLREPDVRGALGLHGDASRFLDEHVARATANFLRRTTIAEALLVPSMAFLDEPRRWNLVLFLEKLPRDLPTFIRVTPEGVFHVGSA